MFPDLKDPSMSFDDLPGSIAGLESELRKLRQQRAHIRSVKNVAPLTGFIFFIGGLVTTFLITQNYLYFAIGSIYAIVSIIVVLLPMTSEIDNEIESIEGDILLEKTNAQDIEQRSERLFRSHETELRKYYSQALRHSGMIFFAGLLCLIVGFAIAIFTIYQLWFGDFDSGVGNEKIFTAGFSLVTGLLVNFIALIFMKMFTNITKSLSIFHNRLVQTNRLYFANFCISKIEDTAIRNAAFGTLAQVEQNPKNVGKIES